MDRKLLFQNEFVRVIAMDSISYMQPQDNGAIIIAASNGGAASGEHAARFSGLVYVFNDAGFGKENAGIEGLDVLDKAGLAAATVSHDSARISDGVDTYENGVLSAANQHAAEFGFRVGQPLRQAIAIYLAHHR